MSDLDKIDFIIAVCEADMAISAPERERLCDLLWHLGLKKNEYVLNELPSISSFNEELELLTVIKEKSTKVAGLMDKAEYGGDHSLRPQSCIEALSSTEKDEYFFWIGLCYLALAADHQEDPIGKKLEEAELECLKQIIQAKNEIGESSFVNVVNHSVKVFKSFL